MIFKHFANNIFQQAQAYFLHSQIISSISLQYQLFYSLLIICLIIIQSNSLEHCYVQATIQHQSFVCTHLNRYTGYVRDKFVSDFVFTF